MLVMLGLFKEVEDMDERLLDQVEALSSSSSSPSRPVVAASWLELTLVPKEEIFNI